MSGDSPPRDRPPSAPEPRRIGPDRLEEAVRVLVRGDRAAAKRFLNYAGTQHLSLEHLWASFDSRGRIDASVLVAPGAGRTAMVFASRPPTPRLTQRLGVLLRTAVQELDREQIALAQALVDPADEREEALFLAGGFQRLAELDYLERPVPRFGAVTAGPAVPGMDLELWKPHQRDRLVSLLVRTYENTLDCPGLAGLRRPEDILDGHLASGTPVPEWWHVLRWNGTDAGVLLFNRSASEDSIELVYLGLAPEARGHGLGRALLTHGLSLLDGDRARTIVLAVDRANHPAAALYRRHGFRYAMRRLALVRPVTES